MHRTVKITITTKKGTTQETQWLVWQERPYPDIEKGGSWKWRNADALFGNFNGPAQGIGRNYKACLLRSDIDKTGIKGDRTDYAGFTPYRETVANPGSIVLFGKDLGETEITIEPNYARIRTRNDKYPNDTLPRERDFIEASILPGIKAFIEANRDALHADAVSEMRAYMAERITEAREAINKLEAEAEAAIKAEESRKA